VLAYGLAAQAITVLLASPALFWLLYRVLEFGKGGAVLNYDLVGLALSPLGLLLVLLWATVTSVLAVIVMVGPVVLTAGAGTGRVPPMGEVLARVAGSVRRTPGTGTVKLGLWVAAAFPVVSAAGAIAASIVLKTFGWAPEERLLPKGMAGLPLVLGGAAVLAGLALVFFVRWSLALHALALEGRRLGGALKRSVALVRGSYGAVGRALVAQQAAGGLAIGILTAALAAISSLVLRSTGEGAFVPVLTLLLAADAVVLGAALVLDAGWTAGVVSTIWLAKTGGPKEGAPAAESRAAPAGRWLAVVGLAFAGAIAATVPVVAEEMDRLGHAVEITAHRGSSGEAPENTLAAIELAIADGADWCEIDVLEASDGTIVVVHDENLKRLAGLDKNVYDMTGAELAAVDVGRHFDERFAGERIPRLEEVIRRTKGRIRLNIEIKVHKRESDRFAESVLGLVEDGGIAADCVITSLDESILREVRRRAPEVAIGQIITAMVGRASALDVDFYSVQPMYATVDFIRRAHREGRAVHVWGVNDEESIRRHIDRGADNLITDYPKVARAALDARTPLDDLLSAVGRLFRR
jgi:glycerophosphoryl diester phosphodiesterase